ncbi:hypothetical protein DSO57_1013052 [Entomophthora muscae]|uniref:Uncharacterized protein n=1 Tax=Entomophthora muscae TaxID=34485 RepID=A0ACC2RWY9_9FUNG|nr:hypothetical protein DSO57_1013052 [Entomophthora muscae]
MGFNDNATADDDLAQKNMKRVDLPTTAVFLQSMEDQKVVDLIPAETQTINDHTFHVDFKSSRLDYFYVSSDVVGICTRPQVLKLDKSDHSLVWFCLKTASLPVCL